MIDCQQFREYIVRPALQDIQLYDKASEELLVATCAQESLGGTYVKQKEGPAQGPYQMEPKTYNDLWITFLAQHMNIAGSIFRSNNISQRPTSEALIYNWRYATQIARVLYMQRTTHLRLNHEPLPQADNLDSLWDYYKTYWNTRLGAATKDQFVKNYYKFTGLKPTVTVKE